MYGLVVLGVLFAYVAFAIVVTALTVWRMRTGGASAGTQWFAGGSVALVFYLIPFWDWIPTVVAHNYYCAKEAKFEVFKTVEQWKAENPEIVGRLKSISPPQFQKAGEYDRYLMNQRIAIDGKTPSAENPRAVFLSVKRIEGRVIDRMDERVLAQYVDFGVGYSGGGGVWKFWLSRTACDETPESYRVRYAQFQQQFQQLERETK
jgi:hypothetical protein